MCNEKQNSIQEMSVEELMQEAIRREQELLTFYESALSEVGLEAKLLLQHLHHQHRQQISQLENILAEIREMRELTLPMVD